MGALPPLETPTRKGGTLPLHGAHTAFSLDSVLRLYGCAKAGVGSAWSFSPRKPLSYPKAARRREAGGKSRKETPDSKSFLAVPLGRPPAQQGSAAIRTRTRHKAAAYRPARGEQSAAAPAAKQAAKRVRKRPLQNPSMPRQRRGPRPAGRTAQQSAPTTRQRHTARTRRARRRRAKGAVPPCRAGSAAIRTRSRHKAAAYRPTRGEQSVAARREAGGKQRSPRNSKSFLAVPTGRPPAQQGSAAIRTRTGAARPAFHGRAARRFFKIR